MKPKKVTALSLATAVLTHPEVQKLARNLAEAGFDKAKQWWAGRASRKVLEVLPELKRRHATTGRSAARKKKVAPRAKKKN